MFTCELQEQKEMWEAGLPTWLGGCHSGYTHSADLVMPTPRLASQEEGYTTLDFRVSISRAAGCLAPLASPLKLPGLYSTILLTMSEWVT